MKSPKAKRALPEFQHMGAYKTINKLFIKLYITRFSWDINLLYSTLFSIILHAFRRKETLSIIQAPSMHVLPFTE